MKKIFHAVIAVVMLMVMGTHVVPAHAAGNNVIEIHKVDAAHQLGSSANGLPQDTSGMAPIAGATFKATRVPGIDVTTNEGQRQVAGIDVDEALSKIVGTQPQATARTDINGHATLESLEDGLYVVQEIDIAEHYMGSAPFLVALPLTNPATQSGFMSTVHVYPKDAQVGITLDVIDGRAVKVGDVIDWESHSNIPLLAKIDSYNLTQTIAKDLELTGDITVSLDCVDCPRLKEGEDYRLTVDGPTVSVDFLEPGLKKLEESVEKHPTAKVEVALHTVVLKAGIHINEATVSAGDAFAQDTAETKSGPLSVRVYVNGNPAQRIAGAGFRLYLSEEDARNGVNWVEIDGTSEWFTGVNGRLVIDGLRYSNFANGLDIPDTDESFHQFWVAPTVIPDGWRMLDETPQTTVVYQLDVTESDDLIFVVDRPGITPDDPDGGWIGKIIIGLIPLIPILGSGSSSGSSTGSSVVTPENPDGVVSEDPAADPAADPAKPAEAQGADSQPARSLAETGAQVIGIFIIGLVLVGLGLVLVGRRKAEEQ
ncbi:SpaH/EbpB family LPXTG-anchored major pilin [Corynebacterium deserti]|nr:SpaH/EbpB family LPXTG-anchored major pilin [Corynebacterium deserti]